MPANDDGKIGRIDAHAHHAALCRGDDAREVLSLPRAALSRYIYTYMCHEPLGALDGAVAIFLSSRTAFFSRAWVSSELDFLSL